MNNWRRWLLLAVLYLAAFLLQYGVLNNLGWGFSRFMPGCCGALCRAWGTGCFAAFCRIWWWAAFWG